MAIEDANYISDLDVTLPKVDDALSHQDDHTRMVKKVLKQQFTNLDGAVTARQSELNKLSGASADLVTADLNLLSDLVSQGVTPADLVALLNSSGNINDRLAALEGGAVEPPPTFASNIVWDNLSQHKTSAPGIVISTGADVVDEDTGSLLSANATQWGLSVQLWNADYGDRIVYLTLVDADSQNVLLTAHKTRYRTDANGNARILIPGKNTAVTGTRLQAEGTVKAQIYSSVATGEVEFAKEIPVWLQ